MFEVSEPRSVRRSEIYSRSSSAERSTLDASELLLREQFERTYICLQREWSFIDSSAETVETAAEARPDDAETYEFRLFSKNSTSKSSAPNDGMSRKIILRSPTPTNTSPGFLTSSRPDAYYFTDMAWSRKGRFESTAVAGEEIIKGLKDTWYGFQLPWRVKTISPAQPRRLSDPLQPGHEATSTKKRNGKKRRIAIRKQAAIKAATESQARRTEAVLEVAEKEKRTRRNREKKVKKRQRDKLKKVSTKTDPG
ncbi:hypothetical protein MMC07_000210 [Pseudocyphellaria aurata]|nr:hypothetical protein [Pseudocyphellaria aurata]